MLEQIKSIQNPAVGRGAFYDKIIVFLTLLVLAGCTPPAEENKEGGTKKGNATCEVSSGSSLTTGQELVANLTCTATSVYQGKRLNITYDASLTSLKLVVSGRETAGQSGKLTYTLPKQERFQAKLKLTGVKAGKGQLKFKILSKKSNWAFAVVNGNQNSPAGGNGPDIPKQTWKRVASSAGWSARGDHTSVVFNNKIWVIGGYDGRRRNDVWSSSDGKTWTKETASAGWSARNGHASVVFNNKIWVIGGYDGDLLSNRKNDVWSSSDGKTWTKETASAGWSTREYHTSVVFNNKIWVIGGYDPSRKNDVWSSSDGKTWTKETSSAGWSARNGHASVVFSNKIWVIGGFDGGRKNDVWSSSDGKAWTKETSSAGWSARTAHTSVAFNNKIWVMGGVDDDDKNDVWSSSDGKTWTKETSSAGWSARGDHTSVAFNNKIWVMGGLGGGRKNDVWEVAP